MIRKPPEAASAPSVTLGEPGGPAPARAAPRPARPAPGGRRRLRRGHGGRGRVALAAEDAGLPPPPPPPGPPGPPPAGGWQPRAGGTTERPLDPPIPPTPLRAPRPLRPLPPLPAPLAALPAALPPTALPVAPYSPAHAPPLTALPAPLTYGAAQAHGAAETPYGPAHAPYGPARVSGRSTEGPTGRVCLATHRPVLKLAAARGPQGARCAARAATRGPGAMGCCGPRRKWGRGSAAWELGGRDAPAPCTCPLEPVRLRCMPDHLQVHACVRQPYGSDCPAPPPAVPRMPWASSRFVIRILAS